MHHTTQFAASLGLRYPIFQAPVGRVAGPELAVAVSEAGAMGALPLTWMEPEETRRLITAVQAETVCPFKVNFVLAFEPRSLPAALEVGARMITFSWGLPVAEIPLVRSFGARFGIQVTTVEGARRALDLGPDFLICQGFEAGGHVQATQSLWDVLPLLVEAARDVPVVAAGGIGSGWQIAHALAAGAAGVMLGTRFVATQESLAHEAYKRRLVAASSKDAALTVCFDGGWPGTPHRVLRNPTLENWEAAGCPPVGHRPGEGDLVASEPGGRSFRRYDDAPPAATTAGDVEAMCLYAGTGCGDIEDIPNAQDLVQRLWQECRDAAR